MSGSVRNLTEAMRKQKYSASYIDTGGVMRTKAFKALANEMLPDELLLKKNLWLLNHKHWGAVSSGLDKGYKAKHIYSNGVKIINENLGVSREELERRIAGRIAGLGRRLGSNGKTG